MSMQYTALLSRLAHPGFLTATDIEAALTPTASIDHNKFVTLVADLCILTGTPSSPRLHIAHASPYKVILCDGFGYPLFRVKMVGDQYQVESLRNYSFKRRGNNRNILHSVKPQYLVKQMKTEVAKVLNHPAFDFLHFLQGNTYNAVTNAVSDIANKARASVNYVTDSTVLLEMMQVIRGELPLESLSHNARGMADTYYSGTKKIVDDRANVSNTFAKNFLGKTFYGVVCFGEYGFGVCTIGVKSNATMASIGSGAHKFVDVHGHYRMFKSLAKFQELAPDLYNDVYLQMAMNKNAMTGMGEHAPGKTVRFVDALDANKSGGDRTFLSLMPCGDFYNEALNAFGWWQSSVGITMPNFYFMEKVS
jgi:hypothetical protein